MPRSRPLTAVPAAPRRAAPRRARALRPAAPASSERERERRYFITHLRAVTSRRGVPYAERSIGAYLDAVISLERYLRDQRFEGSFLDVGTEELNGYLRAYFLSNTPGGTNTKQRNLRPLFDYLAAEYGMTNPYLDPKLNRYAPSTAPPSVLDPGLIESLLAVTKGNSFEDRRDHAIIRLFLSGMRREEMTRLRVQDVDLDNRVVRVAGLKGGRERYVPFGNKTAHALSRWLRLRASNPYARSETEGPLWLASRNRAALTGNGIYTMLRRRATEAGYAKESVRPHMFRHTRAHEHLEDGGSEGDLMRTMGWRDRSMVDRYAADLAAQRAIEDAHRRGLDDRY